MDEFPKNFDAVGITTKVYEVQDEYDKTEEQKLRNIRPKIVKLADVAIKMKALNFQIPSEIIHDLDIDRIRKLAYELIIRFPKIEFYNQGKMNQIAIDRSQNRAINKVTNMEFVSPVSYFIVYFESP